MQEKSLRTSVGLKVALIAIPIFIGALDLTVVSAVLPQVILDLEIPLQTGLDDAAWIVTGYLLAYSVSMTFMGRLSDLLGRRKVFLAALAIFALGSYLVAAGDGWPTRLVLRIYYMVSTGRPDIAYTSLYVLIGARMIQAFGAGSMVPVGMALIGDLYPEGNRARPLGVIAAVDTAGWVVGHLYGGIIVRFWTWKLIFWLNLPICLLGFLLIWYFLKDLDFEAPEGRMDWLGALLIGASLSLLNAGLGAGEEIDLEQTGDLPGYVLPTLIAAGVLLILFIWRQRKTKFPLIDLSLFKLKNFLPASLANLFIGIGLFIAIANVPLFINSLVATSLDQGAWDSGWLLSALTVPMALAAVPGGWLTDRTNYRLPSILGLVLAVLGFILMNGWVSDTPYLTMIPQLTITGIGLGLTMAPIAAAVVNASPPKYRGTGSAMVIIFRLIGMTVGVSGITTYDLRRSEALVDTLAAANPNMGLGEISTRVLEQVIGETFLIAGLFALLALLPIVFLSKPGIPKQETAKQTQRG